MLGPATRSSDAAPLYARFLLANLTGAARAASLAMAAFHKLCVVLLGCQATVRERVTARADDGCGSPTNFDSHARRSRVATTPSSSGAPGDPECRFLRIRALRSLSATPSTSFIPAAHHVAPRFPRKDELALCATRNASSQRDSAHVEPRLSNAAAACAHIKRSRTDKVVGSNACTRVDEN